ncbi:MAG: hypothetical protein OEM62_00365 [Acidobacteriota bacterium]|nr:hypothetical protein [Acidobacteriota bacterium]
MIMLLVAACQGQLPAVSPGSSTADAGDKQEALLLGEMKREDVEVAMPEWVSSVVESEPDIEASLGLTDLTTDARVTVFFGSWCSDSRRELSRLWKALDVAGGETSFPIRYVGVDRSKTEPATELGGRTLLYVPTLIVEDRDGIELGRIIEESPHGVEVDLLALLEGNASGWISARQDLPQPVERAGR